MDNVVHRVAADEVIIHHILHFAPPAHVVFINVLAGGVYTQSAVGHAAVGFPFNTHRRAFAGSQRHGEFVAVGIPCRAPAFGHHFFAVDIDSLIARIIHDEVVVAGSLGHYIAFIHHFSAEETEILGRVHHVVEIAAFQMLEIDLRLAAGHHLAVGLRVCPGQCAFIAVLVVKPECFSELFVVVGATETEQRIAVPQHAIVACRHHERHRHFSVVLEQFFAQAFVVEFVALMLAETVEPLAVIGRRECLLHRE